MRRRHQPCRNRMRWLVIVPLNLGAGNCQTPQQRSLRLQRLFTPALSLSSRRELNIKRKWFVSSSWLTALVPGLHIQISWQPFQSKLRRHHAPALPSAPGVVLLEHSAALSLPRHGVPNELYHQPPRRAALNTWPAILRIVPPGAGYRPGVTRATAACLQANEGFHGRAQPEASESDRWKNSQSVISNSLICSWLRFNTASIALYPSRWVSG